MRTSTRSISVWVLLCVSFCALSSRADEVTFDQVLEGDTLRFYVEAILEGSPLNNPTPDRLKTQSRVTEAVLNEFLPHVRRAHLKGTKKQLLVSILLDEPEANIDFFKTSEVSNLSLYGFKAPHYAQYKITQKDGVITLVPVGPATRSISVKLKIPIVSDNVYLHSVSVDLGTGVVRAEAGVIGDSITVYAKAKLYERKSDGIEVGKTILANAHWLIFPTWSWVWQIFKP
jgi:hypothetical protein